MNSNPTAGIGDPYWYKWSVGLFYVIEMLNPDSEIESVTLQSSSMQGLDDVIVSYVGHMRCIQVKHTRISDTLTFGDLVTPSEGNTSLLRQLARAWKEAKDAGQQCEARLFTNRSPGTRKSTVTMSSTKGGSYERPPLSEFWPHISGEVKSADCLARLNIPAEWRNAWDEWCAQLDILDTDENKLAFLKSLVIEYDQPDLSTLKNKLLDKIAEVFGFSSSELARPILQSLDHALREWVTTARGSREAIDREMVYNAISLPYQEMIGYHTLPPPEPFFLSRQEFVNELEKALLNRTHPVIFLTGPPGSGKTSIISNLSNRHDPLINLRFHAYRPITPDNPILPADAGRTTTARALWSDLLSQLRTIFAGRLARYRVPIRNDFLDVDQLREHVLRLANILASEHGRPCVIAIDGIDHAARAGLRHQLSFLETLVPPEGIPKGVCFLIAGQPAEDYENYPFWLKTHHNGVSHWIVPSISENDIVELIKSTPNEIPMEQIDAMVRLILSIGAGNTLATVFAVHEATFCSDITDLQNRLQERRLHDGISAYYQEIWSAALQPLRAISPFIGYQLAGCLSLSSERLNGTTLAKIYSDLNISPSEWTNALRALRPLVVEEPKGFRVMHNDLRVHLMRQLQGRPEELVEVASHMADYLWVNPETVRAKHIDLFNLLRISGREKDIAYVFTPEYVVEACGIQRPMNEILEQCKEALAVVTETSDWDCLHTLACAVETVKQLRTSLGWMGEENRLASGNGDRIPPVLLTEGRVPKRNTWTKDLIGAALHDALYLIKAGEVNRSKGLIKRWLAGLSPGELISLLPENEVYEQLHQDSSGKKHLSEKLQKLLRQWGHICQHVGIWWDLKTVKSSRKQEQEAMAHFFGGWLEEATSLKGRFNWARSLQSVRVYYPSDLEFCIERLALQRRWRDVALSLKKFSATRDSFLLPFLIRAAVWALICNRQELFPTWVTPIIEGGFEIEGLRSVDWNELGKTHACMCFALGWAQPYRPSGGISEDAIKSYYSVPRDERERLNYTRLFYASAWAGRWMGYCVKKEPLDNCINISEKELKNVVSVLLRPDRSHPNMVPPEFGVIASSILEAIVECAKRTGPPFEKSLFEVFLEHANTYPVDYTLEVIWRYLFDHGEYDFLREWFDKWAGPSGKAWREDLSSRFQIVNRLVNVAIENGWHSMAESATKQLNWGLIGYTDHKEYSLHAPLMWIEALAKKNPTCWENEGIRLLALSKEASRVGDNRLSHAIEASIGTAVAKCGIQALWRLLNSKSTLEPEDWLTPNDKMLFDGLIGMLETANLTEQELKALWGLAIGGLLWKDGFDRVYIADIKTAILRAADRLGFNSIESVLYVLAPAEYHVDKNEDRYRIPDRWFSSGEDVESIPSPGRDSLMLEVSALPLDDAISLISRRLDNVDDLSASDIWRATAYCAKRLVIERPSGFKSYAECLLKLVYRRRVAYGWTFDGVHRAYEELIPLLEDETRWEISRNIIQTLDFDKSWDLCLEAASENIDYLCRYRACSVGELEIRQGLNRILRTHELWVEGGEHLLPINRPVIPAIDDLHHLPKSWSEFATHLLIKLLESDSASVIEAALRGLWAIMQVSPEHLTILAHQWDALDRKGREGVLLLAERVAAGLPSAYTALKGIVDKCYEGNDLRFKLQAWVVLQAYERSTGIPCKTWTLPQTNRTTQEIPDPVGLLDIPAEQRGMIFTTRGASASLTILKQLAAATGDDVSDIESKLAAAVKNSTSLTPEPQKKYLRSGNMLLIHSIEIDILMNIVYDEMCSGRWAEIPLTRLAQALTLDDDPFVLLSSPYPAIDKDTWPVDDEIEQILKSGQLPALKERLMGHIFAGIQENEAVLSAILYTYTRTTDIKYSYENIWKIGPVSLQPSRPRTTFNGRAFALYDENRFEPSQHSRNKRLTFESGGLGNFIHQNIWLYPASIWQTLFGWSPSPSDPTIWLLKDGQPVVRFEKLLGPLRDQPWDRYYRQPMMQRWVVKVEALENIKNKYGGLFVPSSNIDVFPFIDY